MHEWCSSRWPCDQDLIKWAWSDEPLFPDGSALSVNVSLILPDCDTYRVDVQHC